ncbi:hypothetical protein CLV40_115132 [Actinokineospora auranticolor]|uniref:Uncharacterized protein n=1 Tax=Actinokineospora auranticolor TaxID=155976 RepID=A0A2S6GJ93_9PSEU|nr:hypothetical protein CLV40_115132 [Actinokineospora auranticolor]
MPDSEAASRVLRRLADNTSDAPGPPGAGAYHHVHTVGRLPRDGIGDGWARGGRVGRGVRARAVGRRGRVRARGRRRGGRERSPDGRLRAGGVVRGFLVAADPVAVAERLREGNPDGSAARAMKVFAGVWKQRLLLSDLAGCPDISTAPVPAPFRGETGRGGRARRPPETNAARVGVRRAHRRAHGRGSDGVGGFSPGRRPVRRGQHDHVGVVGVRGHDGPRASRAGVSRVPSKGLAATRVETWITSLEFLVSQKGDRRSTDG